MTQKGKVKTEICLNINGIKKMIDWPYSRDAEPIWEFELDYWYDYSTYEYLVPLRFILREIVWLDTEFKKE